MRTALSTRALTLLTDLLRAHRRNLHTQWRALPCDRQALLVLARLRKNETYLDLAAGFEIGVATVCRYVHEAVDLLASLAPTLAQAVQAAAEKAYVILDGTVLPIDRVFTRSGRDGPYYSGKAHRHGMNVQTLADPAGRFLWASPALPGAVHDVRAARRHGIPQALAAAGVRTFADKGYQGAGPGVAGERRRVFDHYLKGSLWCGRCHAQGRRARLIITKATGRHGTDYFYFLCRGRQDGLCDLPYLPMEHVEDAVLDHWASQSLPEGFAARVRELLQATLDETNTSARLLHDQLTTELARIDRQEEHLLDLAADATLATDKVRTRLTRLQVQRREIQQRLKETGTGLEEGAAVLTMQLDLLAHPQDLYRQLSDHGRRLLNQAFFDELLIDREDLDTHVTGQAYTEPVRDLMTSAQAYRPAWPRHTKAGPPRTASLLR